MPPLEAPLLPHCSHSIHSKGFSAAFHHALLLLLPTCAPSPPEYRRFAQKQFLSAPPLPLPGQNSSPRKLRALAQQQIFGCVLQERPSPLPAFPREQCFIELVMRPVPPSLRLCYSVPCHPLRQPPPFSDPRGFCVEGARTMLPSRSASSPLSGANPC